MDSWSTHALGSVLALAAVAAAACTSPRVLTLERAGADFAAQRTYGFPQRLGTDEPGYGTLLSRELESLASRELEARGYTRSDDPDLLLDFHVLTRQRLRRRATVTPVYVYYREDDLRGEVDYAVRLRPSLEQTLRVAIIEARSGHVLWEGAGTRRITDGLAVQREVARETLGDVLASYPYVAGQGSSVRPRGSDAFESWLAEAERGDAAAAFLVAVMYHGGHGVARDTTLARRWYQRSAEAGNPLGQRHLGWMLLEGIDVPPDEQRALDWLTLAAEQDDAPAQLTLSAMYRDGLGVERDDVEAAGWTRRAAEQGVPAAQADYGLMCLRGQGTTEDHARAAAWLERAARQGFAPARTRLGRMHELGRGVARDEIEALAWYRLAAAQGDELALEHRQRLERLLTPEQVEQAARRAAALDTPGR